MTQLRLEDFSDAYRAAHSSQLDAPAVLRRIRGTLRGAQERRSRRRWVTWLWSMGLTTALGASLAYAAPIARELLQWVDESFKPVPEVDPPTTTDVTRTSMGPQTAPASSVAPVFAPAASLPSEAAHAASTNHSARSAAPRRAAAPSARRGKQTTATLDAAAQASSLYDAAQRLQFAEHDYANALTAWDRYLQTSIDAPLRGDARYNRAVCLVHLKRYEQARVELARLAHPDSAAAYRSRAATLLNALGALSR